MQRLPRERATGVEPATSGFLASMPSIVLDVVNAAASGPLVFTERVDRFVMPNGHAFDPPVNGVFEVGDGRITSFRDYFDLATFERGSGLKL